jgi:hypothetical protein
MPGQGKGSHGAKTSWYQSIAMIEWLEIPANFRLITGAAQKDVGRHLAGAKLTKTAAYADLATYVNQKCGTNWTKDQAGARFKAMLKNYKTTRTKYFDVSGAKYCLTADELAQGMTIEKKLEADCVGFRRMDQLFGGRQNIQPTIVQEPDDSDSDDDDIFQETASLDSGSGDDDSQADKAQVDVTQLEGSQLDETQGIITELLQSQQASLSSSSSSSLSLQSSLLTTSGSATSSSGKKLTSASKAPKKSKSKTDGIPADLIAAAAEAKAVADEGQKVTKRKDFATSYSEVMMQRLMFEKEGRQDEIDMKRKRMEQDELRFEREERWRAEERAEKLEEKKEEGKWKKVSFVMGMAQQGKSPEEVKEWLTLMNDLN